MSPFFLLLKLVRFTGGPFTMCVFHMMVELFFAPMVLGLVTRAFFDGLAGRSAPLTPMNALIVFVVIQVAQHFVGPLLGNPWTSMQQKGQVLIQRNLFDAILKGYGRQGLRA